MNRPTEQDFSIHARSAFEAQELTEVHILVYRFISKAVAQGSTDTLIITSTHFTWSRQGKPVNSFSIDSHPQQRVSFRDAFDEILTRDAFVRQYFRLVSSEGDETIYRIVVE